MAGPGGERDRGRGVTEQDGDRGVATGVEPLDQRRVSVVCRSTRVDLSLPAHLELVAVVPEVVDLVRDHVRATAGPAPGVDVDALMGGGAGGSWQFSRLAGGALSVSETLAQQRVHDGEILVLGHRPVPTPAPLFDDVLEGLTNPDVARSPAWDRRDAVRAGIAAPAVLALPAAAALTRQWWGTGGATTPVVAATLALLALGAVLVLRTTAAPAAAHAVAGGAAVGFTVLAAGTVGAPPLLAWHLVGAFTAGAVLSGVLRCTVFRPTSGRSGALAAGYLATAVSLAAASVAALVAATGAVPVSTVGAGAVLAGVLLLTAAPRIAVSSARVPIPPVPAPGEDLDAGALPEADRDVGGRAPADPRARAPLPTPAVLRGRYLVARSWLTGLLAAGGAICAAGSLVSLSGGAASTRWAAPLAVVLVVVLILRGLTYAERVHTAVVLSSALALAVGILAGASLTVTSPVGVVVPAALALAAAAVVAVTALPHAELSPSALRAVGALEAVGICLVVPLAIGAMDIYSLVRHR